MANDVANWFARQLSIGIVVVFFAGLGVGIGVLYLIGFIAQHVSIH